MLNKITSIFIGSVLGALLAEDRQFRLPDFDCTQQGKCEDPSVKALQRAIDDTKRKAIEDSEKARELCAKSSRGEGENGSTPDPSIRFTIPYTDGQKFRSCSLQRDAEIRDEVKSRVKELVGRIRQAQLKPVKKREKPCMYCTNNESQNCFQQAVIKSLIGQPKSNFTVYNNILEVKDENGNPIMMLIVESNQWERKIKKAPCSYVHLLNKTAEFSLSGLGNLVGSKGSIASSPKKRCSDSCVNYLKKKVSDGELRLNGKEDRKLSKCSRSCSAPASLANADPEDFFTDTQFTEPSVPSGKQTTGDASDEE